MISLSNAQPIIPLLRARKLLKRNLRVVIILILLLGAATGCVTVVESDVPEARHAPLMVVRSGNYALLSWESERNIEYTILYADGERRFADWRPLAGAERIRGTGREIRVEDRLYGNQPRHYRLMVQKQTIP